MKKISVLIALYHPNLDWLAQQLSSLEEQSYPCLELLIMDDGPDAPVGVEWIQQHIQHLPFQYHIHQKNQGSSAAFEELVAQATGEYIAFCDQDDIWEPDKLKTLVEAMEQSKAEMAYCTMSVIDRHGKPTASDVRKVRRGDRFLQGEKIASQLLIKNCIYGCTMVMRTKTAKDAFPRPNNMTHDHWFSLWAAMTGKIEFVEQPLVRYRIHDRNQSTPLIGIESKAEYEKARIDALGQRMSECLIRLKDVPLPGAEEVVKEAEQVLQWTGARKSWLHRDVKAFAGFCKGRKLSPRAFYIELFLPFLPDAIVGRLLRWLGVYG